MPLVIHEQPLALIRSQHVFHASQDDAMIAAGMGNFKLAAKDGVGLSEPDKAFFLSVGELVIHIFTAGKVPGGIFLVGGEDIHREASGTQDCFARAAVVAYTKQQQERIQAGRSQGIYGYAADFAIVLGQHDGHAGCEASEEPPVEQHLFLQSLWPREACDQSRK